MWVWKTTLAEKAVTFEMNLLELIMASTLFLVVAGPYLL